MNIYRHIKDWSKNYIGFFFLFCMNFNINILSMNASKNDAKNDTNNDIKITESNIKDNLQQISQLQKLFESIKGNRYKIFEYLLEINPSLKDRQDKLGMNALMIASSSNKLKFVKKLIDLGADLNLKNDFAEGKTALTIAQKYNYQSIIDLLLEAGAI